MPRKTETQVLQSYCDEIYGKDFYAVEYKPFRGFTATSQRSDVRPPAQFLGTTSAHAHSHLDDMADLKKSQEEDNA